MSDGIEERMAAAMAAADEGMECWAILAPDEREFYTRMAAAAVQELQLTEEWAVVGSDKYANAVRMDLREERAAREHLALLQSQAPRPVHLESRLVGPWLSVNTRGEA